MRNLLVLTTSIFILSVLCLQIRAAHAINMHSTQYRIQFSDINIGGTTHTSSSYKISSTLGQTAAREFDSNGYVIKAGFQYLHSIIPFLFRLSKTSVNFGTITAGNFYDDTATITVSFGSAGQYQVKVAEQGPLKTFAGNASIPDTTCNGGASTCTVSTAAVWNNASRDGFGYNMTGTDIPADFTDSTYFRPFPDTNAAGSPQVVMSSVNVGVTHQSTIKFRLAVSATQAAGSYQTVVKFVATPSF